MRKLIELLTHKHVFEKVGYMPIEVNGNLKYMRVYACDCGKTKTTDSSIKL